MKTTTSAETHWAHPVRDALMAPFKFATNILVCGCIVAAAYGMLVLCSLLSAVDNHVIAPWKADRRTVN